MCVSECLTLQILFESMRSRVVLIHDRMKPADVSLVEILAHLILRARFTFLFGVGGVFLQGHTQRASSEEFSDDLLQRLSPFLP